VLAGVHHGVESVASDMCPNIENVNYRMATTSSLKPTIKA
jgi:hypothetical protein